jgi:hypothetical protein
VGVGGAFVCKWKVCHKSKLINIEFAEFNK